ncbi:MAG TPA: hypothetical protein V6C90_23480 [Coleofasciculaceae cyanobacterium]|jgi:hypothetical protein
MTANLNSNLPSPIVFFLKVPLYEKFKVDESYCKQILEIECFQGTVDTYCIECRKDSTFIHNFDCPNPEYIKSYALSERTFSTIYRCSRNTSHRIDFCFKVYDGIIQKIGQYPSLADLNSGDIGKYRRILDEEKYKEFSKAVGLASHGVGIGSFVYLRRIFENLIEEAHQKTIKTNSWNEDDYKRSRMDEKIGLLKDYFPEFLVKNKILYSILSKGVHDLREDECLKYFGIVKLGIELILNEKLEKLDREAKIKEAEKLLSKIHSELK